MRLVGIPNARLHRYKKRLFSENVSKCLKLAPSGRPFGYVILRPNSAFSSITDDSRILVKEARWVANLTIHGDLRRIVPR